MRPSTSTPVGWPFLVAAGRRRDYTTLLAPGFLVAELDHGVLEQVVRPSAAPGPPTVVEVRTGRGLRLSVAYATHLLTPADLDAGASEVAAADAAAPDARDEHGRPVRLIYGFASRDGRIVRPAGADLSRAREAGLRAYRSFLADEEAATVAGTSPFRLESAIEVPDATVAPPVEAVPAGTGRGLSVGLVAAAVLLVIAIGIIVWNVGRPQTAVPGPGVCASSPAPSRSPGRSPGGEPSPTCSPAAPR